MRIPFQNLGAQGGYQLDFCLLDGVFDIVALVVILRSRIDEFAKKTIVSHGRQPFGQPIAIAHFADDSGRG